jgi:hypothetical protein
MVSKKLQQMAESLQEQMRELDKAFQFLVQVDRDQVQRTVAALHVKHPELAHDALIDKLFDTAWLKAVSMGFASGLPGGLISMPVYFAEIYGLLKTHAFLIGCVAYVKNLPAFLDPSFNLHLLVVLGGRDAIRHLKASVGPLQEVRGTWRSVNGVLGPSRLYLLRSVLQGLLRNRFLTRVTTRGLPILGGLVGAAFNWHEIRTVLADAKRYFGA